MQQQRWALFSFKGRMRRKDYWFYSIPVMVLVLPTMFYQGGNTFLDILTVIISFFAMYTTVALNVKRLQDRDRNPWFVVLTLVPIVGPIYALIDLGIYEGTRGSNRYGPDPKNPMALKSEMNGDKPNQGTFEG